MGNSQDIESGNQEEQTTIQGTIDVTLAWIPSIRTQRENPNATIEIFTFTPTRHQVEKGLWSFLGGKLVEANKATSFENINFVLENVLTKYEDGNPVFGDLFLGIPDDSITRTHKLYEKSEFRVKALEPQ